jgi:subtilase family serine protease
MRELWVALAIALSALVVLSGGIVVLPSAGTPSAGTPASPSLIASDALAVPIGAKTSPLPASARIVLTLSLTPPKPGALQSFLASVEDPSSTNYRHFLTYAQYVEEFAPTASAVASVVRVLASAGAQSISAFPDRSAVSASFSPAEVRSLFGVEVVRYGKLGSLPLYTATGTLSLPSSLIGLVSAVDGLSDQADSNFTWNLKTSMARPIAVSQGPNDFVVDRRSDSEWFIGSDYTQLFGATKLLPGPGSVANASFPTKVAIATLLAGGYNATLDRELPPWDPSVLGAYFNLTLPPAWPKPNLVGVPVTIGSVMPVSPGSFGGVNDSSLDESENSLDLEMAGSAAPGATLANFYFAGSLIASSSATYSSLAGDFAQTLAEALAYNYSSARLALVSCSFGLPDENYSSSLSDWNTETAAAAITGVTIVAASGDQGDAPNDLTLRQTGPWPTWPASADTNFTGALAVGGVSLTVGGQPTLVYNDTGPLKLSYDSNMTGISSLSAWYDARPGYSLAGTEGGASTVFPEPIWQFDSAAQPAIVNATVTEGAASLGRAEPDLALAGNSTLAAVFANGTGTVFLELIEGTSIGAPLLAGLLADVVAVESNHSSGGWSSLGFFDPEVYRIASYYAAHPSAADPFTSVTVGQNYRFTASPGWDPLTGWGIVNASLLLAADETPTVRNYLYTGPTPGLPPPVPGKGTLVPWGEIYIIFGVGIIAAVVLVLLMARPRPTGVPPPIPPGVHGGGPSFGPGVQGGIYPGATFLCPYCGAVRSAVPGRCPQCGAF